MSSISFFTALAFYLVAGCYNIVSFIRHRDTIFSAALGLASAGFVFHSIHLLSNGMERGMFPLSGRQDALLFLAWTLALAFILIGFRFRIIALGVCLLPLILLSLSGSILFRESPAQDILNSRLFYFHTTFLFLAYAAFVAGSIFAVLYLLQERELKSRKLRLFYNRLPSLSILDTLFANSMLSGLVLMTAGLAAGLYWAEKEWENGWITDPKVVSAIITWLIYLLLTSIRAFTGWRGKRMALITLVGFLSLLLTFWIASLLGGRHVF